MQWIHRPHEADKDEHGERSLQAVSAQRLPGSPRLTVVW